MEKTLISEDEPYIKDIIPSPQPPYLPLSPENPRNAIVKDWSAIEPWKRDLEEDLGELGGLEQGALLRFGFHCCWGFLLRYYLVLGLLFI